MPSADATSPLRPALTTTEWERGDEREQDQQLRDEARREICIPEPKVRKSEQEIETDRYGKEIFYMRGPFKS